MRKTNFLYLFYFISLFNLNCKDEEINPDKIIFEISTTDNPVLKTVVKGILYSNNIYFIFPHGTEFSNFVVSLQHSEEEIYLNGNIVPSKFNLDFNESNIIRINSGVHSGNYQVVPLIAPENLSILVLGNSITKTVPDEEPEWHGDWGMAASKAENDYVHLLIKWTEEFIPYADFQTYSISWFERDYWNTDYTILNRYSDPCYDVIIMRISENIADEQVYERNFKYHYNKFITTISCMHTNIICTNSFWERTNSEQIIFNTAIENGYFYIDIGDIYRKKGNTAIDEFKNRDIGIHPSDAGMKEIAELIFPYLILAASIE
jgi:hypothetical protein